MGGEAPLIAQRGLLDACAQRGAQRLEPVKIGRQFDRNTDIRAGRRCRQFRKTKAAKKTQTTARHTIAAVQGDDGQAEVQRLAGRRDAVIGEGVQGDIDSSELPPMGNVA